MEISSYLTAVGCIDARGNAIEKKKEELKFSYRTSCFHQSEMIIVSAKFKLEKKQGVRDKQRRHIQYRRKTQPYGTKSAGCIFRNPKGEVAGALVEACGLKGKCLGGAQVSSVHGNFILNRGDATARDVLNLITLVQQTVREKTGKDLEIELCVVPYRLGHDV